jgi:hypothetical protein
MHALELRRCRTLPHATSVATVLLVLLAAAVVHTPQLAASGVFNGSAYLEVDESVVGSGTEPDYGVLEACWIKRDDTSNFNRLFMVISNNASGTSRRSLNFGHSNAVIRAETFNGAGAPADSPNSYTTGTWYPAFAWFGASNYRTAKLGSGGWATPSTISRPNVSGLSRTAIGTLWVNGGPNTVFSYSGKLAEFGVWADIDSTERDAIVAEYVKGVRPPNIPATSGSLKVYQPLRGAANEFDKVGPTFNNASGVTYDTADHPPVIYPSRIDHLTRQRME